jgi:DNA adenine methylase
MQYLGGKSKIRKQIAGFLAGKPNLPYLEPFVGGGWVLQEISGRRRLASDANSALITMYQALQRGWVPPDSLSEEEYANLKGIQDPSDPLTAFAGFGCSFAGKWFGGFARAAGRPAYALSTSRSLMKQLPLIQDVEFRHCFYWDHKPEGYLIYCDPPYAGTTPYDGVGKFDHERFWVTMREWSKSNIVLISEYTAPLDFEEVANFNSRMGMTADGERGVRNEKLFQLRASVNFEL